MNFKRILFIILCVFIFSGCTAGQKINYNNEEWGFSFEYPSGWKLNEKSFRVSIQNSEKPLKGNFTVMPKKLSAESNITSQQFFDQMAVSSNSEGKQGKTNIDGATAYWIQFSLKNPAKKGKGMLNKIYFIVNQNVAYQIQYSIMPGSPGNYEKILENIVKSFKF